MRVSRLIHIALSVTFILLITLPFVGTWLPILPQNTNTENRELSTLPELPKNYKETVNLPSTFQAYFKDNFGGRSLLFDLNMSLKSLMSAKPFKDNKLLVGEDGWYFSNFQKVIDDYRAVRPFTSFEIESIQNSISSTRDQLEKQGIKYYLMIVPNKHTIYHDKLPYYIEKTGEQSRLEQIIPALKAKNINFIDIRESMLKAKVDKPLYFKTDSHWNLNGAFVGYEKLIASISSDFPIIKPLKANEFTISSRKKKGGDIVALMGKEDEIEDLFVDYIPNFKTSLTVGKPGNYKMPEPKIFHPENTVSVVEGGITDLKAVVFRDSYGGYLEPFLNPHFKRIVYVWGHDYVLNKDIVRDEKPDLVIQVIVERYIYTILESSVIEAN